MDTPTTIAIMTGISAFITFIHHLIIMCNGKMIHSKCCDNDIEMGVEVVDMPHKKDNVIIDNARTSN